MSSEYHRSLFGLVQGEAPEVIIDEEYSSGESVLDIITQDNEDAVTAVHDCSSGGIGVAIAEMAISGSLGAILRI